MEEEPSSDTSGGGGGRAAQDSVENVSGVTEASTSGNAGEKARRRHGVAGGEYDGLLAVVDRAVGDGGGVDWEVGEVTTVDGDDEEAAADSSSVWRATARLGWLLLGFLAGASVAAAVLFLTREESPVTCTVVPT